MKELKDIKKLGFGLMRLPKNGDDIDIEQTFWISSVSLRGYLPHC